MATADMSGIQSLYQEYPLRHRRDIRVLDIQPATSFDEPLVISLRVVSLDGNERYQCQSYAWGKHDFSEQLLCHGHVMPVTQNLHAALKRFRDHISPKGIFSQTLWVDCICIDQSSAAEKAEQVLLMGDIFAQAQRLIIWLGDASDVEVAHFRASLDQSDSLAERQQCLLAVCQRAWFRRRWVSIRQMVQLKTPIIIADLPIRCFAGCAGSCEKQIRASPRALWQFQIQDGKAGHGDQVARCDQRIFIDRQYQRRPNTRVLRLRQLRLYQCHQDVP